PRGVVGISKAAKLQGKEVVAWQPDYRVGQKLQFPAGSGAADDGCGGEPAGWRILRALLGWNVDRVRGFRCSEPGAARSAPHAVRRRAPKRESGRRAPLQLMHAFKTPEPADAMHRKHLQEIPDQTSNVTTSFTWGWDSSKTSELLSGMGVSALEKEEVDSENIPQELLSNLGHPQSPPRKRLKSKGNDKDFVIVRRPKLNRENFPGK
ncbi:SKP2, partial [Cervus elaphus hippelaphus]